jgi:hypothetical protein
MRTRFLVCVVAGMVTLPAVVRAQSGGYDWKSWGAVTDTLRVPPEDIKFTLSFPFISEGSETVYLDGVQLSPCDYEINYHRGLLKLAAPAPAGALLRVSYVRLPILLNSVYSLRGLEFADPRETPAARVPQAKAVSESVFNPTGDLVFGGMKSISVSVGTNRGSAIDQSLQATVEGHLTSSIKVRALLSDSNLPIQPEGSTEELEYLDKVFVEFTGSRAKATLGDFSYLNGFSSFSGFRRELKGISGEVRGFDSEAGVAGGSSKGVFRSMEFRGIEQIQGPYDLLATGRALGEVIIAGTERVFFDGEILERGRNRDYTIDYDAGTLTFTPRRMVTADSKIGVDFEVTQQRYDRTSVFGDVVTRKLPGALRFETLVARESDDDGRLKTGLLTEDDRRALAEAGDDSNRSIAEGATLVGAGVGDYALVAADSVSGVPAHFEFDDSSGAYVLSFVEVGVGLGDYKVSGISAKGATIYRFTGAGDGNFIIGKKLPMPQSHTLVTGRLRRDGARGLNLDFEYNLSDFDQNTLSPIGNGNNVGDAGKLTVGMNDIPLPIGRLDLTESVSTIEQTFRSLGQARPWYFYADWNLEGVPIAGREILQQSLATYRPTSASKLDYDFGLIRRDDFSGSKHEGRGSLSFAPDRSVTARVFTTDVSGLAEMRTRRHLTASTAFGLWKFLPSAGYSTDEYLMTSPARSDSGFAYGEVSVGLAGRNAGRFGYQLQVSERNTQELLDSTRWLDTRTDRTYRTSLSARDLPVVEGSLEFSHREQDHHFSGDRQRSDLAHLKGLFRVERIGFRSSLDYEISRNAFRSLERTVVFVGPGKGDYNQLGEPVGAGRGDYALAFLPSLETVPARSVGLSLRTTWRSPNSGPQAAAGAGPLKWIMDNVSLEQQFTVREATTFGEGYKVYLLFPSALQRNGSTVHGTVSLQQDWSLLNSYAKTSLNVRYQRDDEEDNRFAPIMEDRFFEQHIVTVNRSISRPLSANLEVRRERRRRAGEGLVAGTGSTYDVTGYGVGAGWGLKLSTGTLDGQIEYTQRADEDSHADERAVSVKPRFVWRAARSVNVFGRYELVHVLGGETGTLRPFLFLSPGSSHRWSSTVNVKWTKILSFFTTYQGRSEQTFSGKRIVEHDVKIETRALF